MDVITFTLIGLKKSAHLAKVPGTSLTTENSFSESVRDGTCSVCWQRCADMYVRQRTFLATANATDFPSQHELSGAGHDLRRRLHSVRSPLRSGRDHSLSFTHRPMDRAPAP